LYSGRVIKNFCNASAACSHLVRQSNCRVLGGMRREKR
jgi:hypothetical protein